MKLNDTDARAVDIVLGGLHDATGGRDGSNQVETPGDGGLFAYSGGSSSPVTPMTANNDLAGRVSHADDLLRLLDYLPADEPPATLLQKTMQRVEAARESRSAASGVTGESLRGLGTPPSGMTDARVAHSPGKDDPTTR